MADTEIGLLCVFFVPHFHLHTHAPFWTVSSDETTPAKWLQTATSTPKLTHPIRLAHFTRFARPSLKMRLASLGAARRQPGHLDDKRLHEFLDQVRTVPELCLHGNER